MLELTEQKQSWIKERFIAQISDLFDKNFDAAVKEADSVENTKVSLGIKADVDLSSFPKLETKLSYSKRVTDSRIDQMDDPEQGRLQLDQAPPEGLLNNESESSVSNSPDGDSQEGKSTRRRSRKIEN